MNRVGGDRGFVQDAILPELVWLQADRQKYRGDRGVAMGGSPSA
jgi:hypothetical protein